MKYEAGMSDGHHGQAKQERNQLRAMHSWAMIMLLLMTRMVEVTRVIYSSPPTRMEEMAGGDISRCEQTLSACQYQQNT